jgi:pentatricopeptide repeat protein
VKPNLLTSNIVIDGMCKSGKLKEARELFSRLAVEGLQPGFYAYTSSISGICK